MVPLKRQTIVCKVTKYRELDMDKQDDFSLSKL